MSARKWCFTLLLVATLVLSACQPAALTQEAVTQEAEAEEPQPQETQAEVTEPKIARFIFTQEFDNLNPLYTNMWFVQITYQLWNCYPWVYDDENNPVPELLTEIPTAENGGITNDGKTITMKLREGLLWSDGDPLDSADFLFTYQMAVEPANSVATSYPYDQLASLETPDATTVVMNFSEPFAAWMGTFWKGIVPEHLLKPVFEEAGTLDGAEWNMSPSASCGPFKFEEWESGSYARFVRNESYTIAQPKLDEIFVRFVPDDASQIAALTAGDGDLGTFFAPSDVPTLEEAGIKVMKVYSGYNEGIYFYLGEDGHPALQDVNVRKAIALGFDRFSITEDLLLGLTVPAATDWDNTPWVDPSIEPWPYDPEQAKTLLDEAGWTDSDGDGVRDKDGVDLTLTFGTTTREVRRDTQAVAQQQLADIGIRLELMNYDSDIFFGGYADGGPAATGELDLFEYSGTPNYPDPAISEWFCDQIPSDEFPDGTNWMAVCDEELDQLFRLSDTQVDINERQQTFYNITKHIFENVYWLGVWQDPDLWGVSETLQNVRISGATPFFNITEWDFAAE